MGLRTPCWSVRQKLSSARLAGNCDRNVIRRKALEEAASCVAWKAKSALKANPRFKNTRIHEFGLEYCAFRVSGRRTLKLEAIAGNRSFPRWHKLAESKTLRELSYICFGICFLRIGSQEFRE